MTAPSIDDLPVCECLPEILLAVAASIPLVLKAPPGAGKTTGIPPALMRHGVAGDGQILLIQPRRLAARSAASRLAKLVGGNLGDEVGYHVRFDKRTSRQTKLIAMTTGVLLRRLQHDPLLENVSCVILDEFHERSVDIDLALGMLHRIRTTLRPELKLLVMSATLDPAPIVEFLGDAKAVTSEGRSFPVDIRYTTMPSNDAVDRQVAAVLPSALKATSGHVLIFLAGVGEIRRTRRTIEMMRLGEDSIICELYGDLAPEHQDAVLAESVTRKIILATNVAETSITIPGVTGVIDSGMARVMRFDSHVGLPKLQLESISQASTDQRAGRAGRTSPGVCYRLWPMAAHRARREQDTPEIQRCDFSESLLTLAAWGERDVFAFPWLTAPPKDAVAVAKQLLSRLGAIDDDGGLTSLGREMLVLPLHPRLSRFMIAATQLNIGEDAALAAAMLTERDPFRGDQNANAVTAKTQHGCDVLDRVDQLKAFKHGDDRSRADRSLASPGAAHQVLRVAEQIGRMTKSLSIDPIESHESDSERMKRALLAAYPDRVARRRSIGAEQGISSGGRGIMVGGRGVRLDSRSTAGGGELFLCIDVDSGGTEALVRSASVIDESWLDLRLIRDIDEPFFNPTLKAVVVRRRRYYEDLMLAESPIACVPSAEVASILQHQARLNLANVFPAKDESVAAFIDRVRFLTARMPELDLPLLDDASIDDVLQLLCQSRTSIADLRSAPWLEHLKARYDYAQSQVIDRHAPARMTLPSGNSVAIQYGESKPPLMEVRIQEIFGWKETPRVAGGRVPVQLHLLGPNYRPQQITEDLANFWKETYMQIRKELHRRYPKHHWPDDPLTATATRNGLKPKST